MLVQPSADENAPFPVLPLILGIQAPDSHYLVSHPVIAPHIVIEIVLVVFQADGKVRRHEEASVELVNVLAACHPGEIIRLAICIRVLSGPVIAVPGNVLCRCEHVQMMVLIRREPVETQASGIDSVLDLLGYHCLVRREIDIVATAAELVKMVILGRQLAVNACLQIGTHPDGLRFQPRQLGESVPVAVIAVLVPHLPKNGHAHLVVIRYEGGIEGGIVVQGGGSAYAAQCVGCGDRVSGRLLCDDVDGPGNGGRSEQCRPAAPHHLDTVHHIGRNLLDAINPGEGAEDRSRVNKYLGIRAFKSIYAHLLIAAILAIVLDADPWLETQPLRKRGGIDPVVCLHVQHVHKCRSHLPRYLAPVGGYHHAVELDIVLLHLEIDFQGGSLHYSDLSGHCLPANA